MSSISMIQAKQALLAALADGPSTLIGALRSRDTDLMVSALTTLGARFERLDGEAARLRARPAPLPLRVRTGPDGVAALMRAAAGSWSGR